jgi:hypothetical protein
MKKLGKMFGEVGRFMDDISDGMLSEASEATKSAARATKQAGRAAVETTVEVTKEFGGAAVEIGKEFLPEEIGLAIDVGGMVVEGIKEEIDEARDERQRRRDR